MKDLKLFPLDYSSIRWIVYIFLGGSLNYLVITYFASYYSQLYPTINLTELVQLIFAAVIVLLTPIILSLILSKLHPEKQIVSPLFMQIVALGIFFCFMGSQSIDTLFLGANLFVRLFYTLLGGFLQDMVIIGIIGRVAHRDDLIIHSFHLKAKFDLIQATLSQDKYQENLNLGKRTKRKKQSVTFRSSRDSDYQTVIEVTKTSDLDCHVNIAFFNRGAYFLKRTEKIEEYSHRQVAYFKEIFERQSIRVKNTSMADAENFLCAILDEMKGYSIKLEKMSNFGWIKIVAIICAICLSIGGYYYEVFNLGEMLTLFVSSIIFGIFELYRSQ